MEKRPHYFRNALLVSLLLIPAVMDALLVVLMLVGSLGVFPIVMWGVPIAAGTLIWVWFFWRHRKRLPDSWFKRILPLVIAPCYYLLAWSLALIITGLSFTGEPFFLVFGVLTLPWFVLNFGFLLFGGDMTPFVFIQLLALAVPVAISLVIGRASRTQGDKSRPLVVLCVTVCLILALPTFLLYQRSKIYLPYEYEYEYEAIGHEVDLSYYQPFTSNNNVVSIPGSPPFTISSDYPRLDGATAAFPVYASLAQEFYSGLDGESGSEYVTCSTTPRAYQRLIDGEVDLIFGAQPSEGQLLDAEKAGVTLEATPLGREAFVFFVNSENPVDSLTLEQIQDIYQKKITNWRDVGGPNKEIIAFQRPEDSGSQTIMLAKVMGDKPMATPLRTEQVSAMGGVLGGVAEYRNSSAAIGYSFRYYTVGMNPHEDIKLLAIDGIEPSIENIRNGTYPFTIDFYAVTAGTSNPYVPKLIDWLTSDQGQSFIEDCGYVRLPSRDPQA